MIPMVAGSYNRNLASLRSVVAFWERSKFTCCAECCTFCTIMLAGVLELMGGIILIVAGTQLKPGYGIQNRGQCFQSPSEALLGQTVT